MNNCDAQQNRPQTLPGLVGLPGEPAHRKQMLHRHGTVAFIHFNEQFILTNEQ